ncbi:hypothetical protein BU16DRAFT_564239 [Lophium mytilinum]|uniref:Uncharacterized protein n=1 Tax=Lophium mytilinum TaxID=390894 RepID=A0A6A6QKF5_9PEZI|nr:hypothetical protein BU16DRAFT_564239 [Lophium mytilinum]
MAIGRRDRIRTTLALLLTIGILGVATVAVLGALHFFNKDAHSHISCHGLLLTNCSGLSMNCSSLFPIYNSSLPIINNSLPINNNSLPKACTYSLSTDYAYWLPANCTYSNRTKYAYLLPVDREFWLPTNCTYSLSSKYSGLAATFKHIGRVEPPPF